MPYIVSCTRKVDESNRTSFDQEGLAQVDQTINFDIVVSEPVDVEWVRQNAPLPPAGSQLAFYSPLVSTGEWDIRKVSPIMFEAGVPFTAKASVLHPKPPGEQTPTKRSRGTLQIEHSSQDNDEPIDTDFDGHPIATWHGEQFDPPITTTISDHVITVSRDVEFYDVITAANARNKTNSEFFSGIPKGMGKITQFDASYHVDDEDKLFWRQTVRIVVRYPSPYVSDEKSWWKRVRAEGFMIAGREVTGTETGVEFYDGKTRLVYRAPDNPDDDAKLEANPKLEGIARTSVPVLHSLTNGKRITDPTLAEWYLFRQFGEVDFASLNII